jgi:predicted nuclease with RNAse H fold
MISSHVGIDYGSKTAGTTAICINLNGYLWIEQSGVKKDADEFIKSKLSTIAPTSVFLDAPLSLPKAYFQAGDDFMFRKSDREVQAMSPMFLGGLTARAMKLASEMTKKGFAFHEAYPKQVINNYFAHFKKDYKQKFKEHKFLDKLDLPLPLRVQAANWHQVDAVLAWYAGYRFIQGTGYSYGEPQEGLILA